MSEPNIILAEFIERRDKVFLELSKREPSLVEQLTYLNAAIAGMEAESKRVVRKDEYSRFHKPSDALFYYLDRARKPQPRDEMCQALVDGGYSDNTDDPYWSLVRGVYYQIKKKRLVERNGLIGKSEWPKELWSVTQKERPAPKD